MNLPPFKLERYFAKYEFNTEYLLCSSDCEAMSIADLLALEPGSVEKFQHTWLGYTEPLGHPALRKEIANIYEAMQPNEILVHTGAEEAIYLFMHAVLQKNDHVIVLTHEEIGHGRRAPQHSPRTSAWLTPRPDAGARRWPHPPPRPSPASR